MTIASSVPAGRPPEAISPAAARVAQEASTPVAVPIAVSAIVPVYNGRATLEAALTPLLAMQRAGELAEVIVVDDGSGDDSASVALGLGARVLDSGGRLGPGGARNRAAPEAVGEVLWFVDADVVVRRDAARKLAAAFAASQAGAIFGSYDDAPPAMNFFSQYKNLVHHYYHQRSAGAVDTFWAGCGAVRKEVFLAVGGFDEEHYPLPSIEDIELGARLRERGIRIELHPDIQGTHLKTWHLRNLLRTEILQRAVPWSRLIQSRTGLSDALNVGREERARALLALVLTASLPAALLGAMPGAWWLAGLAVTALAHRDLLALFARRRGPFFAIGGLLYHQVYYTYASAAYAWVWCERLLPARRAQGTRPSASS